MKKQDQFAPANKLAFNKEKVANLSPAALDQIQGGLAAEVHSTHADFTCKMCTTLTGVVAE